MRRNDVFFVKSRNDSHLVTLWQFSLQSKLGARPHSAAIVCVQTETENFQIHSLGRAASSFIFIHPEVRFYQQPRAYQVSNLNPQSSISSSFQTISFLYHSLPSSLSLLFIRSTSQFLFTLILFIHKYFPSTKRVFFTDYRKSPFIFCYIFAATGGGR